MPAVVITAFDAITACGQGAGAIWDHLMDGRTAIGPSRRPYRCGFDVAPVAHAAGVDPKNEDSALWQLLQLLLKDICSKSLGEGVEVFLATTVGEVELLERAVESGLDPEESALPCLAGKVERYLGLPVGAVTLVSTACASGSAAVALAAQRIHLGLTPKALVIAGDVVSEFVLAGFSSLMALDKNGARPFDKSRQGLSLGDGVAVMVLMKEELAHSQGIPVMAEVSGWGLSDDANHITGPSRDGAGLADAIQEALRIAGIAAQDIACISAHGTGTLYNDAMEMQAFKKIFNAPVPTYGIKGVIGHTLGAAGLIEIGLAARVLKENIVPSTVGMMESDPEAEGWLASVPRQISGDQMVCVNAGFGGVNAAVCLRRRV